MSHINLAFTDSGGTALPTHDAKWTPYSGVSAGDVAINTNAARRYSGTDGAYYYNENLGETDFAVTWDHYLQLAQGLGGVTFNNSATTAHNYLYIRSAPSVSEWQLYRVINGTWTKIGFAAFTFADDTTYACRIERSATDDTIIFSVDGVETISVTDSALKTNDRVGLRLEDTTRVFIDNLATESLSATPTISNVDGDNAVNQGQLVNINVADFTETITAGDIGGVAFPSIPDNDPADDVIQVRMPVTLAAGTYDVTISGATKTATISGVAYAVTHQYQAPYGLVDSNSDWKSQKLTEDTYWRVITPFAHGTYDFTAGAAETPPFGNDINDHFSPDAGYVGSDSEVREVLYADGTTDQYTVNIEIGEGGTVVVTDGLWRDLFRDPTSEIFTELFR